MGDTITDNVSLYTLMEPSPCFAGEQPTTWQQTYSNPMHYVGVEWQLSKPKGFSPRDFCFLDYQDSFFFVDQVTGQERRGWARCLHSVALDCCPDMEKSAGIIRAKIVRSGHVFIESTDKEGVLDYYKNYYIVPGGNLLKHFPTLYMKKMLKQFTTSVLNLEEHLIQQRLRPILDVPVSAFQSKKDVASCMHCSQKFSWLVPKKQCRSCGDIACSRCCSPWQFHLDSTSYVKVDLCQRCILDEAELPTAFSARTSRTTSRSSRVHSAHNRSHHGHRSHYSDDIRASDGHNYRVRPSQFSHYVHPRDTSHGQPSVIMLGGPADSYQYNPFHQRDAAPCGSNSPDSLDSDDIHVISPTELRGSQMTLVSSARDVLLTFHSDSSSIYL
ncbi:hypothetical protein, variant [Aphanomyces invadans]|nr:hypothetical protein, variant [Aphanomyces invadans]ETW03442.1 hypothetical protein, variant [Aphanomyces invadans]|eukprot:XP_008867671.1 hypothetical protein, variant [Aphanomyces invadans]